MKSASRQIVSHYRILRRLGAGGMGEVDLAEDLRLHRRVALKRLHPGRLEEPTARARLRHEARAVARLSHPNIATLHDLDESVDPPLLVFEYVEGRTLAERLAEGPLPVDEALRIAGDVAEGLACAHGRGIVHRDIKPTNLVLGGDGRTRILDFGLAHVLRAAPHPAGGSTTWEGAVVGASGTLPYMAPEQIRGEAVDPRGDLYSLGAVLFEMVTGEAPFHAPTAVDLAGAILRDPPPPLRSLRPGASREVDDLVQACLQKEADRRPPSARAVAARLTRLLQAGSSPATEAPSLAVLPFVDMSPEQDQGYFCEGMAEELIHGLQQVPPLRVASRTASFRFRDERADLRCIGRELGVGAVLEGSVRKAGEHLRVSVRLVGVDDGYPLWSAHYDRDLEDVLALQDEIAHRVVDALQLTLSPHERAGVRGTPSTRDARAYDYWLRGRRLYYQYRRRSVESALRMYDRALQHDRDFALAHAGRANCWCFLFLYADRRRESLEEAEAASRLAVRLGPDLAEVQAARGQVLSLSGRHDEARLAFAEARRLGPSLFEAHYLEARDLFAQGLLDEAVAAFERAIEICPEDYQPLLLVAQAYESLGRHEDAQSARRRGVALVEERLRLEPGDVRALYMGANGLVALGERERSLEWAELALAMEPDEPMVLYNVGCVHALAGQIEPALDCLEKAVHAGLVQKGWLLNDSNWDPLRSHARYRRLLEELDRLET